MELVERFKKLYSGVVCDAMQFDMGIKPGWIDVHRVTPPDVPLVGPVFTCRGKKVTRKNKINDDIRLEMLAHIPPGSVILIDGRDTPGVAHFGDISATLAIKAGAVGVVIDGNTRDVDTIWDMDFPVFCRGTNPHDAYGKWQIVEYRVSASWLFADADGAIFIPSGTVGQVCELAEERAKRENEIRAALLTEDPKAVRERFGRW